MWASKPGWRTAHEAGERPYDHPVDGRPAYRRSGRKIRRRVHHRAALRQRGGLIPLLQCETGGKPSPSSQSYKPLGNALRRAMAPEISFNRLARTFVRSRPAVPAASGQMQNDFLRQQVVGQVACGLVEEHVRAAVGYAHLQLPPGSLNGGGVALPGLA